MKMQFRWLTATALAAAAALAVETKTWTQSDASDFEKGQLKGLAVSSEGRLSLAPVWKELADAGVPHLWCAARDAKGNVFAGGAEGKVMALDAKGKSRVLATLEGGSVYALALGKKDEVYAAVSPEAKVYRIESSGKSTLFASLKARYVWALVWGADGALYAATGDPGQIHRIATDGKSSVLFDAEETHVRSLAADGKGNLIAGTEPGGVVLRVSAQGTGFVLYQTAKREVTALAVTPDGSVYAAASGTRTAATAPAVPAVAPPVAPATAGTVPVQVQPRPTPPPPTVAAAPGGAGSDVYRISADGEPQRVWSNAALTVYALAVGQDGRILLGTGNEGRVYRVDTPFSFTRLADIEPQQVTALAAAADGSVIGVTANPGKVFQMGPGLEKSGAIESEVFDAGAFTYWGRLRNEGELNGGSITLEARSGNLERAQKNWSAWTSVDAKGERITAPPARYLSWRATLTAAPDGKSPVLKLVEAAYQAKNAAPVIEKIEITPANYKFPAASQALTASTTLTLPPMGQRRTTSTTGVTSTETGSATMNFDKGWMGARWRAQDANGDTLESKVEIRGADEREWKLMKDKLKEARYGWDATGLADGRYKLRVTVTDAVDNYPGQGLSTQMESEEFVIDNTPPQVDGLTARVEGNKILVSFKATDVLTPLQFAEFSINGGEWIAAQPTTRITDSLSHDYSVEADKPAGSEYTVAVKVADENDNVTVRKVTVH